MNRLIAASITLGGLMLAACGGGTSEETVVTTPDDPPGVVPPPPDTTPDPLGGNVGSINADRWFDPLRVSPAAGGTGWHDLDEYFYLATNGRYYSQASFSAWGFNSNMNGPCLGLNGSTGISFCSDWSDFNIAYDSNDQDYQYWVASAKESASYVPHDFLYQTGLFSTSTRQIDDLPGYDHLEPSDQADFFHLGWWGVTYSNEEHSSRPDPSHHDISLVPLVYQYTPKEFKFHAFVEVSPYGYLQQGQAWTAIYAGTMVGVAHNHNHRPVIGDMEAAASFDQHNHFSSIEIAFRDIRDPAACCSEGGHFGLREQIDDIEFQQINSQSAHSLAFGVGTRPHEIDATMPEAARGPNGWISHEHNQYFPGAAESSRFGIAHGGTFLQGEANWDREAITGYFATPEVSGAFGGRISDSNNRPDYE